MNERRIKRSDEPREALQYLVESLKDRSDARSVALVDPGRHVLAFVGAPKDVSVLRDIAEPVAHGVVCETSDESVGTFSRPVDVGGHSVYLAALGTRMHRFVDAANAIERISRERPLS